MTTAAARDAWEAHEGRANGQNDPSTGKPYEKPAAPEPPAQQTVQTPPPPAEQGQTPEPPAEPAPAPAPAPEGKK